MPRANWNFIGNCIINIPSLEKQNKITAHLDAQTARIDGLVSDIRAQVEKLKQYRQIVIHEAVTGKIKTKEELKP